MDKKIRNKEHKRQQNQYEPFENAAEVWFWFIAAQQARQDGARFVAGQGMHQRPCEPADIMAILTRLHRNRLLKMDHFHVLRHYGRRHMAPDPTRVKEKKAYGLWCEAMDRLTPILERKGIIRKQDFFNAGPHHNWVLNCRIYERAGA